MSEIAGLSRVRGEIILESHGFVFDSSAGVWIADTKTAAGGPGGGSTQVSVKEILTSSGASVMDSTQNSIGVTIREGAAAGSTLVTVRQSTVGDLRAAVYQSTAADLNVTVAGYSTTVQVSSLAGKVTVDQNSTVWPVQIPSSQSIQVKNSTIGDLLASVQQNSTVWQVQQGGYVAPSTIHTISTGSVRVHQSTAADLNVTVAGYSTEVTISTGAIRCYQSSFTNLTAAVNPISTTYGVQAELRTSSGARIEGSTASPASDVLGLHVRGVLPALLSTGFSTMGNNSTSSTVVSSAAGVRHKVYAYSITSTMNGGAANTLSFNSSLGNVLWPVVLRAISSGITGVNLAVTPPAFLFATDVANPLVFKITGGTGTYHLAFSYFTEA